MPSYHDELVSRMTPQGVGALLMALSMATNFLGYEFARSANLSLFTSTDIGFTNPMAFSMATACVSPFSFLLLIIYGRDLHRHGPRLALRNSTFLCITVISMTCFMISMLKSLDHFLGKLFRSDHSGRIISKMVVGFSFIFQNTYTHLLCSQQWSFINSILTAKQGALYFASIAGLSSISSTIGGALVPAIVDRTGLIGLLACTTLSLLVCCILGDLAYIYSEKYGFNPANQMKSHNAHKIKSKNEDDAGILKKAYILFKKEHLLGALFLETLCFQSVAELGNICLIKKLKQDIINDAERAAWTGKFYALINGLSGFLQFFLIPRIMSALDSRVIWISIPLLPLICFLLQSFESDHSLFITGLCYTALKTIDYSIRNVIIELVYVSLDFESRFLGKEIIGVLGNRLGKSGISVVLSLMQFFVNDLSIGLLMKGGLIFSFCWLYATYSITRLLRNSQGNVKKDL